MITINLYQTYYGAITVVYIFLKKPHVLLFKADLITNVITNYNKELVSKRKMKMSKLRTKMYLFPHPKQKTNQTNKQTNKTNM